MTEDELKIYRRFTSVLSLTYRRYQDLKEAEAQTREAQIEAALERVRAKTMAMHKSEQLAETAKVLFEQFDMLGKIPDRISIGIIKEDLKTIEWWVTDQSGSQLNHGFSAAINEPTSMVAARSSELCIAIAFALTRSSDASICSSRSFSSNSACCCPTVFSNSSMRDFHSLMPGNTDSPARISGCWFSVFFTDCFLSAGMK